jgi:hypothetical protein
MTVHSDTEPVVIQIDRVENGIARLLVHWDIRQVTVPEDLSQPEGEGTRQEWQYSERVIKWTLPQKFADMAAIQAYLDAIQAEILNWAEATELTIP